MPRPKKHPSVRQRTNRAAGAATLHVLQPGEIVIPDMPELYDDDGYIIGWTTHAIRYWRTIWSSPMAPEFHKSDIEGLYRLVALVDQFWRGTRSQTLNAEIRLYEAQFGLNPLARRRLEWQIESTEEAQDKGEKRTAAKQQRESSEVPAGQSDPYAALA